MTTSTKMKKLWAHYRCIHASSQPTIQARVWNRDRGLTPAVCSDAWSALEVTLLAAGYPIPIVEFQRKCPTGIKGRPCQGSGVDCSLHNYGLAIDIDPFAHGNDHFYASFGSPPRTSKGELRGWSRGWDFRDCKLTQAQVDAVEAIKTRSGARVFQWLGWTIGDTMHFQIDCSPSDLSSGIQLEEEEDILASKEELEEIIRKVINEELGAIAIPGEPNRKAYQTMVNSTLHAKVNPNDPNSKIVTLIDRIARKLGA